LIMSRTQQAAMMLLFALVAFTTAESQCHEQAQSEDISAEPAIANALLQVKAEPRKVEAAVSVELKAEPHKDDSEAMARCAADSFLEYTHLDEARLCLPKGLQEANLRAVRRNTFFLKYTQNATRATGADDATLDAAGFKEVTSLCCPPDMEIFFGRLLDKMNLEVCSKPHLQGLMHWFACVPDMDYAYVLDVINNGNPCKYWGPKGATCPELSEECAGTYCR
jgi:hypothetical protein